MSTKPRREGVDPTLAQQTSSSAPPGGRTGYVVKRYPRYSETFIVNEILAHEASGKIAVEIFALAAGTESHYQHAIAAVRAPVTFLTADGPKSSDFWSMLQLTLSRFPHTAGVLAAAEGVEVRDIYQAMKLAHAVAAKDITHLHAHFATSATTVARIASQLTGVPYSFTAHAKDIFHDSVCAEELRTKIRGASTVVTVSEFNLRFLRDQFPDLATDEKVKRIYNGLHLDALSWRSPQRRPPVIAAVGRLVEKKGFADVIDACDILCRAGRAFQCLIVGDGELSPELRERINRLDLENYVRLLGPRPQAEVFKVVQEAAVFAAPCVVGSDGNRDGLPTVILEAMALGTPCISTDVTGIPEVVRDMETGLVVPQHDAPALAAAIERLLDQPALRVKLSNGARRLIESEFDIAQNSKRLREIFKASPRPASKRTNSRPSNGLPPRGRGRLSTVKREGSVST